MWSLLLRNVLQRNEYTVNLKRKVVLRICKTALIRNKAYAAKTIKQSQVLSGFNADECERILDVLNKTSFDDLLCHDISKSRASKLHAWRMKYGPLQRLEDILQVEGFAHKTAEKFFKSLLENPHVSKAIKPELRTRTTSFVTPPIDEEFLEKVRSCLSIRVGVASITWSRLELPAPAENNKEKIEPCLLTHWQHYDIEKKKLHLHELVQHCLYVHESMPTADCYIFESPKMAQANNNPGNVEQQNVNIHRAQMTAIFSYALAARPKTIADSHVHVYYLRRFLTARLFSTLIGTERVSSEDTVLRLMRIFYNNNNNNNKNNNDDVMPYDGYNALESKNNEDINSRLSFQGNVQFPMELRQMFAKAERAQREFLGQVLLLNLAFVRLVLLHDANSIAVVTRGNSKVQQNVTH